MIELKAVREAASRFLPKLSSSVETSKLSHVEQEGLPPMPKDRGAEQRDVDGPLECSLALGMVAAETRGSIVARQAAGTVPWIGVNDPAEEQRLRADHATRLQESANFQFGGAEKFTGAHDPQHALQKSGRCADQWYTDRVPVPPHARLPQLAPTLGPDAARLRHQRAEKDFGNRAWTGLGQCRQCGSFLDPQLEHAETCSTAEGTRGHDACVHAVVCGLKLAAPRNPKGSHPRHPGRKILSTPLLSQDALRPWMGVWSPPSQRQLVETRRRLHRELSRNEFVRLRQQSCCVYGGRPTAPGCVRFSTQQSPPLIGMGSRCRRTSLQRRRKHEIQIALLRRRAAMACAVLPCPPARAEWLFEGITERACPCS